MLETLKRKKVWNGGRRKDAGSFSASVSSASRWHVGTNSTDDQAHAKITAGGSAVPETAGFAIWTRYDMGRKLGSRSNLSDRGSATTACEGTRK